MQVSRRQYISVLVTRTPARCLVYLIYHTPSLWWKPADDSSDRNRGNSGVRRIPRVGTFRIPLGCIIDYPSLPLSRLRWAPLLLHFRSPLLSINRPASGQSWFKAVPALSAYQKNHALLLVHFELLPRGVSPSCTLQQRRPGKVAKQFSKST